MRPPPKFRPDAFASVPATAVAVVIFAAIVPGFSVAEECGRAYAGMHDAHLAVVQGVGEVRNFEISTKFSKYGKRNALLGGGLETCGFNVKTARGANRYLIRGASTERGWDRIPSEFDYPSQGSVVEAQVATPDGARVPWLAGITFVRRANPGEEIGVGVGLKLKARLLDDWVSMQSNLAWAGVEGGLESLVGLAQRHQLAARMLDRNQHSIGLRTTLQFERVEPDYGGPTANRDPDRQSTEVGTELSLDGASLKVSRSLKFFDHQNNSETVKVKLRLSKNFATAFVNERQFDLHSDDGPRTDTANALAFSWKRAFGAIKLQHRVKVSYVEQESEPDTGVDMSYEFKARSRYQDNLYWKLGVEMGRRETENDRFRLFSSIYVRL
jgi:hypothetical protein